jgi:glycerol-3-phosphate cytidylyltransferase-like family protein
MEIFNSCNLASCLHTKEDISQFQHQSKMVFKRLTQALTTAGNTVLYGSDQAEKIRQLEAMGFHADRARHALNACENNVERAAELLLLGGDGTADMPIDVDDLPSAPSTRVRNIGNSNEGQHVAAHNDEQMRLAIEASLATNQAEESRNIRQAETASMNSVAKKPAPRSAPVKINRTIATQKTTIKPAPRSAAAINAGKAAAARTNQLTPSKKTLDHTHPNVKLPEKLSNKSKEEQIMRCANRLKPHVMAVDTLIRVLISVRNSPENIKFRTIDRTNANYVEHVRDKPGAEDLLLAMNYRRIKNELRLERHLVDPTLLYLGISALEQMRSSEEYLEAKKWRAFHAEMKRVSRGNGSHDMQNGMTEVETEIRLGFLQKCPKEPPEGRGAIMNVYLGDEKEKIEGGHASRRFDGDDTLQDVLNWLGGCYGVELIEKLHSREWCLCDLNRYPISPLDVEKHCSKTIQYLGLFPSGKLGVRLSEDEWKEGGSVNIHGSARGLGAASRSMLH